MSRSKTASLFTRVTDPWQLTQSWNKTQRNRGAAGGDNQTIADFETGAVWRIERLSRELRGGVYVPGPLRHVEIPKRHGGGMRTLSIPCVVDRVAQSAAAAVLSEYLEPHFEDESYGYRPGRSHNQAVERVAALRRSGFTWVVDADIRSFFDEIPHGPLLERLRAHQVDEQMVDLVRLWLDGFSDDPRGLAQGSPVSPVLANLYLDALDEAMAGDGVRMVRYADDFVILTRSQKRARRALDKANKVLGKYGLVLNPEKTRIVPFEKAFTFLGRLFIRSVCVADPGEDPAPPESELLAPDPAGRALLAKNTPVARSSDADSTDVPVANDLASGLRPLYVLEPGSQVVGAGEGFSVYNREERELLRLPAVLVGRIEIGPAVEFAPSAMRIALGNGLPVNFLDGYGASLGILRPALHEGGGGLHLAQARLALDEETQLETAKNIVFARLKNQHALLKRLNRRRKNADVETVCDKLWRIRRRCTVAKSIGELRGREGQGSAQYWSALGRCLVPGWTLGYRRADPVISPVAAVLNWTAALLLRDVRAAALRVGLHPGFGAMHAAGEKRDACVYDLIEAFRAPLAEGLTIYLFNNRILRKQDFVRTEQGVRVAPGAGRDVVKTYEKWLARPVKSPRSKDRTVWRNLILEDCQGLKRALLDGKPETFLPYQMDF